MIKNSIVKQKCNLADEELQRNVCHTFCINSYYCNFDNMSKKFNVLHVLRLRIANLSKAGSKIDFN
jgi:hypothetical protein